MYIACYLVDWSPASKLVDKTPHKGWTSKNTSPKHIIISGCDAYVHIAQENKSNLDNKYEQIIFIGYRDSKKGYKLWNPVTKKIVYSWDVVFREGIPPK